MAHKYETELKEVSDKLQDLMDYIDAVVPSEMSAVKLKVKGSLQVNQSFIHSLLGYSRTASASSVGSTALPPITHVMGEKIEFRQPVAPADVTPSDNQKDSFLAEVKEYYDSFVTLTNEKIGEKCKLPGGGIVIRAVAKKAGLADYNNAKLNFAFFDKIRKELTKQADDAAKHAQAEADLKNSKSDIDAE